MSKEGEGMLDTSTHDLIKLQVERKKKTLAQAQLHYKIMELDKMIDEVIDEKVKRG